VLGLQELDYLDGAVANPKKPFAAIVGGSKVSTKITVIESLLNSADIVILGGGMIFTFYKVRRLFVKALFCVVRLGVRVHPASPCRHYDCGSSVHGGIETSCHQERSCVTPRKVALTQVTRPRRDLQARGIDVGASMVEEDQLTLAKKLESMAADKGVKLILPTDVLAADRFAADAEAKNVPIDKIPKGWMGLDIGEESTKMICDELDTCKTVVWNGPMGVFEFEKFSKGTFAFARKLAEITKKGAITIIGGGDSVAAVEQAGLADQMSHISTGGGASLELLEGKVLPGVAALDDQ
jgi:3-phosphoglycerate kinase